MLYTRFLYFLLPLPSSYFFWLQFSKKWRPKASIFHYVLLMYIQGKFRGSSLHQVFKISVVFAYDMELCKQSLWQTGKKELFLQYFQTGWLQQRLISTPDKDLCVLVYRAAQCHWWHLLCRRVALWSTSGLWAQKNLKNCHFSFILFSSCLDLGFFFFFDWKNQWW